VRRLGRKLVRHANAGKPLAIAKFYRNSH